MNRFLESIVVCGYLFRFAATVTADEVVQGIGASTNGIYASATYTEHYPGGGHFVAVFVHFRPPNTNIAYISQFDIHKYSEAKYISGTNSLNCFIGFIELKSSSGHQIRQLLPQVNAKDAYPAFYTLKEARRMHLHSMGLGPELPLTITGSDPEVGNFHLNQMFGVEKPGDYQLTVWPKIYRRSETNADLCERLDLPPVTLRIHWAY